MRIKMKKSFLRKILMVGLGLTFVTQSCTDLDEELHSEVLASEFFKTPDEFISSLGQAYASFGGLGNHSGLWTINELASDEVVITTKGGDWYDGGTLLQLHRHQWAVDHGFFNNTWTFLYGGVSTCNRLIYQFSQVGTAESEKFISELRAVRALWYYWLLDSFGNVPLVTDFLDTAPPSNATRAQVYNFVLSEIDAVIDDLPTNVDASTYGRMTRWAALAIKCKVYLNAEVYTRTPTTAGTPQWQKAIDAAEEIINDGPFVLEDLYATNFQIRNQESEENIFVYPYDKVFAQGFNWSQMTLHYVSQDVYQLTEQPWNGYATVEEFYNSYIDPGQNPGPQGPVWKGLAQTPSTGTVDERLTNFIVGPQFKPDGTRATDPGFESETSADPDPDGAPLTFTPEINEIHPNSWRQGGARIGKYEYEMGGTPNMSNDFVIFRLSDIILSLAEAKFRLGDAGEALVLVNQVRQRAGVDDFGSLTEENLLAERGREMFAEMVRRQDLIRFGKFTETWWEKATSDSHYELFPIPKAQRDANKNLTQNPGY
jgi:starch-binding outer membrane protein, SusD/RagB family